MTVVTDVCLALLAVSAALALVRMLRGPTLPDRVVALDSALVIVVSGIAVLAARTGEATYLGVLIVISLLGFVGTITVARFVERRGP